MRKLLVTAAACGLVAVGAVLLPAQADSTCDTTGVTVGPVTVDPDYPSGTGGAYSGRQVCYNDGAGGGLDFSVSTGRDNSTPPKGYVVIDGASTNTGTNPAFDGYIGVSNEGVVGCGNGEYDPSATTDSQSNNRIVGVTGTTPDLPTIPPNPDDPTCGTN